MLFMRDTKVLVMGLLWSAVVSSTNSMTPMRAGILNFYLFYSFAQKLFLFLNSDFQSLRFINFLPIILIASNVASLHHHFSDFSPRKHRDTFFFTNFFLVGHWHWMIFFLPSIFAILTPRNNLHGFLSLLRASRCLFHLPRIHF